MITFNGETMDIPLSGAPHGETHLRVSFSYLIGGNDWYDGKPITRGYYLICAPVEIETRNYDGKEYAFVKQALGSGCKFLLKQVGRRTEKGRQEAMEIAKETCDWLVRETAMRHGLTLESV